MLDIAIALILHLVEGLVNYLWEAIYVRVVASCNLR